jgi:DNA-binding winged helix-turn-helix (wHTH) protein
MRKQPKQFFEFGPFRLDVERGRLTRLGEIISLTPKATSLLVLLLKHQGQVVEKETILETLWPDTVVEESNLTQTVHLLRKALNKYGDSEPRIETLPKIGYRLIGRAQEVWEDESYPKVNPFAPSHEIVSTGAAPALAKLPEIVAEKTISPDHIAINTNEPARPGPFLQPITEKESIKVANSDTTLPVSRSSVFAWHRTRTARMSTLVAAIVAGMIFGALYALLQLQWAWAR